MRTAATTAQGDVAVPLVVKVQDIVGFTAALELAASCTWLPEVELSTISASAVFADVTVICVPLKFLANETLPITTLFAALVTARDAVEVPVELLVWLDDAPTDATFKTPK